MPRQGSRHPLRRQGGEHDDAAAKVRQLRDHLLSLQETQALGASVDGRLQLGRDVFARGAPNPDHRPQLIGGGGDQIAFLWACLALVKDNWSACPTTDAIYTPKIPDLFSVEKARVRVRQRLADHRKLVGLEALVSDEVRFLPPQDDLIPEARVRRRSAWTNTLVACLEMAKQGELSFEQGGAQAMPTFTRIVRQ